MGSSLAERLVKNSKNIFSYVASEDKAKIRDWIDTGNIALNSQISADPFRGIASGIIYQLAGPESAGKTFIAIEIIKRAQENGYTVIYYDTEGSLTTEEFIKRGLDENMIVHSIVNTVKSLQTDLLNQFDQITEKDKLIVVIDSIGMLSSLKEISDAKSGSEKADFTRPKELRSFFRTITAPAKIKQIPIIAINHTYDDPSSLYGGQKIAGGGGSKYSSSVVLSITKSQHKEGTTIVGSYATCTAVKNRYGREKTKVKVEINFNKGMSKWSGLFDVALECGFLISPTQGWYCTKDNKDSKFRRKEVEDNDDFWNGLLKNGLTEELKKYFSYQSHADSVFESEDVVEVLDIEDDVIDLEEIEKE